MHSSYLNPFIKYKKIKCFGNVVKYELHIKQTGQKNLHQWRVHFFAVIVYVYKNRFTGNINKYKISFAILTQKWNYS